jgi:hypothetical protein
VGYGWNCSAQSKGGGWGEESVEGWEAEGRRCILMQIVLRGGRGWWRSVCGCGTTTANVGT